MRLLIDGIIFQKEPFGGIARLYREILPRMCDLESNLHIGLFIDGPLSSQLPVHPHIQLLRAPIIKPTLRLSGWQKKLAYPFRRITSRTWQVIRSLWLGYGSGMIWHSTYYTFPQVWKGKQVVTVYDLVHEHFLEMYDDPLDEVARQKKRQCIDRADRIICISETTRQDLEQIFNIDPSILHVIPVACSPAFRKLDQTELKIIPGMAKNPFLLYVGRRWHYKNFSWFLKAFSNWHNNLVMDIVVTGMPFSQDEKALIVQSGLGNRVLYLGTLDDESLCNLYNQAAALVFPSKCEGFGIPLLEAFNCGCPVISSRIPTSVEVAGDIPFYFELDDSQSLYSAMDKAITEGRLPARVNRGLERARQYSWDSSACNTLDVYRELWDTMQVK